MNEWILNTPEQKPKQHVIVEIMTRDGRRLLAAFLKDINKYVRNVDAWKMVNDGKYLADREVKAWRETDLS